MIEKKKIKIRQEREVANDRRREGKVRRKKIIKKVK